MNDGVGEVHCVSNEELMKIEFLRFRTRSENRMLYYILFYFVCLLSGWLVGKAQSAINGPFSLSSRLVSSGRLSSPSIGRVESRGLKRKGGWSDRSIDRIGFGVRCCLFV